MTRAGGALVVQAGTATSTRVREQEQSFNTIDIADGGVDDHRQRLERRRVHGRPTRSATTGSDGRWRIVEAAEPAH